MRQTWSLLVCGIALVLSPASLLAGDLVLPGDQALGKLTQDLENIGFPAHFIRLVIKQGVKVRFMSFKRGEVTALYDPGSNTLKLDKSFLNSAGDAIKGLDEFRRSDAMKIGEIVHEIFHGYIDFFGVNGDLKYDQETIYNEVIDVKGKKWELDSDDAAILQEEHMAVWVGELTQAYLNLYHALMRGPASNSALGYQNWKNGIERMMRDFDGLIDGGRVRGYVDDVVIDYDMLGAEKIFILDGFLLGIRNCRFLNNLLSDRSAEIRGGAGTDVGDAGKWEAPEDPLPPHFMRTEDGQWYYATPDNDYIPVHELDENQLRDLGVTSAGQREQLGLGTGGHSGGSCGGN